jgi:hypothetical protein
VPSLTPAIVSHEDTYTRRVLILPPGHAQTVRLRRLTAREKWMVRGVAGAVALITVAVVVIALATAGRTSARGCINATIPGPVGAEEVHQCGAGARETCATVFTPGAYTKQAAMVVAEACRKAGLPAGR